MTTGAVVATGRVLDVEVVAGFFDLNILFNLLQSFPDSFSLDWEDSMTDRWQIVPSSDHRISVFGDSVTIGLGDLPNMCDEIN